MHRTMQEHKYWKVAAGPGPCVGEIPTHPRVASGPALDRFRAASKKVGPARAGPARSNSTSAEWSAEDRSRWVVTRWLTWGVLAVVAATAVGDLLMALGGLAR